MDFSKLFFIYIVYMIQRHCCLGNPAHSKIFKYPENYTVDDVPVTRINGSIVPFEVRIDIIVWSITTLSLQHQEMEVDLMVNLFWSDERLTRSSQAILRRPWVLLGHEASEVWKPRLLFRNCKGCKPVSMHPDDTAVYVDDFGQLWAEIRTLTKFTCAIDLRYYPMDIQICKMEMFLIEATNDVIILKHDFHDKHKRMWSNMTISEFRVHDFTSGDCTFQDFYNYTYSCVEVIVHFERLLSYHFLTSYAPTTFIVLLSWISFWLAPTAGPPRVALGLTSLLTLATRLDHAQKDLPPVSYVKAIDVWMFACITIVSASLLEFAVSHFTSTHLRRRPVQKQKDVSPTGRPITVKVQPKPDKQEEENEVSCEKIKDEQSKTNVQDTPIDKISRVVFPVSFAIFNIAYWSYYLPGS